MEFDINILPKEDNGFSVDVTFNSVLNVNPADFVTYTGASQDVDLGTHILKASGLRLSTSNPYVVSQAGDIGWNAVDGTYDMRLLNGVTLQAGQELHFYGKATENISNRDVVQFAGVQGNHILLKRAVQAEIALNPSLIVGIATDNISTNGFGYVTYFGKVNDVFTTGFSLADMLYFDSSGSTLGGLTKTAPSAPYRKILMATVIKLATGASENGVIMVRPTFGVKLDDLDDVDGNTTTVDSGNQFIMRLTSGLWKKITETNLLTWIYNNTKILDGGNASTNV